MAKDEDYEWQGTQNYWRTQFMDTEVFDLRISHNHMQNMQSLRHPRCKIKKLQFLPQIRSFITCQITETW